MPMQVLHRRIGFVYIRELVFAFSSVIMYFAGLIITFIQGAAILALIVNAEVFSATSPGWLCAGDTLS